MNLLKYHHQVFDNGNIASIVEMQPQQRTLLIKDVPTKIKFEHTAFVFQYQKISQGFYWRNHLRIVCRNRPFNSLNDDCLAFPTESTEGFSCLDHKWDNYIFPCVNSLLGTMLDLWLNSNHFSYSSSYTTASIATYLHPSHLQGKWLENCPVRLKSLLHTVGPTLR